MRNRYMFFMVLGLMQVGFAIALIPSDAWIPLPTCDAICPVGIKNCDGTCWLNAVLQSLAVMEHVNDLSMRIQYLWGYNHRSIAQRYVAVVEEMNTMLSIQYQLREGGMLRVLENAPKYDFLTLLEESLEKHAGTAGGALFAILNSLSANSDLDRTKLRWGGNEKPAEELQRQLSDLYTLTLTQPSLIGQSVFSFNTGIPLWPSRKKKTVLEYFKDWYPRTMSMTSTPFYLILSPTGSETYTAGIDTIDIGPVINALPGQSTRYNLIAVISRFGSIMRGVGSASHAVAYVKKNGKWFCCNDHVITLVDPKQLFSGTWSKGEAIGLSEVSIWKNSCGHLNPELLIYQRDDTAELEALAESLHALSIATK